MTELLQTSLPQENELYGVGVKERGLVANAVPWRPVGTTFDPRIKVTWQKFYAASDQVYLGLPFFLIARCLVFNWLSVRPYWVNRDTEREKETTENDQWLNRSHTFSS